MASTDAPPPPSQTDIRPTVAYPDRGLPIWLLLAGALGIGIILFAMLDAHRRSLTPAVTSDKADLAAFAAPPPLYIPPPASPPPALSERPVIAPEPVPPPVQPVQLMPPQQPPLFPNYQAPAQSMPAPAQPQRNASSPALVIDTGVAVRPEAAEGSTQRQSEEGGGSTAAPSLSTTRARAGVFANRPTTVPQGTLIAAVLESALDTTRPGFARAIISRDIRSFDGSRVLIPRGSRLIGEVGADTKPGQKRALINWTRLIRPDGATIAIGSPATDPLGGTGIRAKVNSHFWERFSGAIMQSVLDLGVNLATREVGGSTIIALPGSLGTATGSIAQPQQIMPTLTVARGTSISVFVARDLDFTGVETRR